jgi:hypothetical protein
MGYNFHITRAKYWFESAEQPITAAEWLEFIANDAELQLAVANGEYFVDWVGHPSGAHNSWFDWLDGDIYTKHPDEPTFLKMLQIACFLNAGVQGDDGERYAGVADFRKSYGLE